MKPRIIFTCIFALLLILISLPSHAMVPVTCLDRDFVRGSGAPTTQSYPFRSQTGPVTITVYNGAQDDSAEKVSSSIISVDGVVVFDSSNLNQNVDSVSKTIDLIEGSHALAVELRSKPGGKIRCKITEMVEGDAAAYVGPEGLTFSVENPASPIYGVGVKASAGAFQDGTLMTISVETQQPAAPLPEGFVQEGPCISFESSNPDFQEPVFIKIPFEDEKQEDEIRLVFIYDEDLEKWEIVIPYPTTDPNVFIAMVNHFSPYVKGEVTISDTSIITGFQINVDTLRFNNDGFENNGFEPCEFNDPELPGVCSGSAFLSSDYFRNWANSQEGNLMCRWDEETAARAACEAHGIYLDYHEESNTSQAFEKLFRDIVLSYGYNHYSYIIGVIKYNASLNLPTPVFMRKHPKGHAVVAYGWRKTGLFSGEILIYK